MKRKFVLKYFNLYIGILLIGLCAIGEYFIENESTLQNESVQLSRDLEKQRDILQCDFDDFQDQLVASSGDIEQSFHAIYPNLREGNFILVYDKQDLIYWSSNQISFSELRPEVNDSLQGLVRLPNGWYWQEQRTIDSLNVVGLIQIKSEYYYHNRYLRPHFAKGFRINDRIGLDENYGVAVSDKNGETLFYVNNFREQRVLHGSLIFVEVIFLLGFIFILLFLRQSFRRRTWPRSSIAILLGIVISVFLFFVIRFSIFPQFLRSLPLFSSFSFAYSFLLASVGDVLIGSILVGFISTIYWDQTQKDIRCKSEMWHKKHLPETIFSIAFICFSFLTFVFLFDILILNSNLNFQFTSDYSTSILNILAFGSIVILYFSFIFVLLSFSRSSCTQSNRLLLFGILSGVGTLFYLIIFHGEHEMYLTQLVFYYVLLWIGLWIDLKSYKRYRFYYLIVFAMLGAMLSNYTLFHLDEIRIHRKQELLIENLVSERDATAEVFIAELENNLLADSMLINYMIPPYDVMNDYIRKKYLQGSLLRNYEFSVTICSMEDSLNIEPDNMVAPCYEFFRQMMLVDGVMIPETNFYFLDRMDGRKSYLGAIELHDTNTDQPISIFIELNSELISEGTGYPELLLDEKINRSRITQGFSYAKYHNGFLVDRKGYFDYAIKRERYPEVNEYEKLYFKSEGSNHLIAHVDDDNYIIVSYLSLTSNQRLIRLPYFFIFFYLIGLIMLIPQLIRLGRKPKQNDLKTRIQYAIVLLVLGTITVVGIGVVYYNISQFQVRVSSELNEKVRNVTASIEASMLDQDDELSDRFVEYLSYELIDLSEIFRLDINVFDSKGELLTTSRGDIFTKGLIGNRMHPNAYHALVHERMNSFQHQEKIGKLSFFSVYVPLLNDMGDVLGYINIPYFSRQDELLQELSSFIVAFINIFMIIAMITLIIALFISKKITVPLTTLEQNLRGVQWGESNKKIEIESEDEIGRLVAAYNLKIDELLESANRLARSERESAWREMARQVAHEIKNPLTPMKLSIQYLQLAHSQKRDNFEDYFKRVTATLIEQIENLAKIASSFSDFAKIPKANRQKISLFEKVDELVTLLSREGTIRIHNREVDPVFIFADKEHFSQIFINLVKNAQQAVANSKDSIIDITVRMEGKNCILALRDNGGGISPEAQARLFTPYFTTKSSGTGLGLAITKSLIENANGKIWFDSTEGIGTTFYVQLPLYVED